MNAYVKKCLPLSIVTLLLFYAIPKHMVYGGTVTDGIKIISPRDGEIVKPGQTITLKAASIGRFTAKKLLFVHQSNTQTCEPPFETKMNIPNLIGQYEIAAVANDLKGNLASDKIVLEIEKNDSPVREIIPYPDKLYYEVDPDGSPGLSGYSQLINAKIRYADGTTCETSPQKLKLVSANPRIVQVDNYGTIIPQAAGETEIIVTYKDTSSPILISIKKTSFSDFPEKETVPPKTTLTVSQGLGKFTRVTLTAEDNPGGSGVKEIQYHYYSPNSSSKIGEKKRTPTDKTDFGIPSSGIYIIQFSAYDNLYNKEKINTVKIINGKIASE